MSERRKKKMRKCSNLSLYFILVLLRVVDCKDGVFINIYNYKLFTEAFINKNLRILAKNLDFFIGLLSYFT